MLLTARLSGASLLLARGRPHVVRSPRVLRASRRSLNRVTRCSDVLYLAWSHSLGGSVELVRHARRVQLLLVLVLGRPMLAQSAESLPIIMLNGHIHPVLHIELVLVLLELALVADVVRSARPRIDGCESIRHRHHLCLIAALMHGTAPIVIVVGRRIRL